VPCTTDSSAGPPSSRPPGLTTPAAPPRLVGKTIWVPAAALRPEVTWEAVGADQVRYAASEPRGLEKLRDRSSRLKVSPNATRVKVPCGARYSFGSCTPADSGIPLGTFAPLAGAGASNTAGGGGWT